MREFLSRIKKKDMRRTKKHHETLLTVQYEILKPQNSLFKLAENRHHPSLPGRHNEAQIKTRP